MATTGDIAQALAIACLNQESFIKELVAKATIGKPAATKEAKFLGETVGEFYQAVYSGVMVAFTKS